ncbi:MAG: PEP-CTERM sorting domain-containing protein [Acidobacteriaceae bacterium]|nr:PEP-CTERM sorting domain-containing protein [Acidobacteriaceae bacterium]
MKKILFAVLFLSLSGLAKAESIVLTGTVTYSNSSGKDMFTVSNDGTTTQITDTDAFVNLTGLDSTLGGGVSIPMSNQTLVFGSGSAAQTLTISVDKSGNITMAVSGASGWSFTGTTTTGIGIAPTMAMAAPEPGPLALLGSGILGLAGLLRRRLIA